MYLCSLHDIFVTFYYLSLIRNIENRNTCKVNVSIVCEANSDSKSALFRVNEVFNFNKTAEKTDKALQNSNIRNLTHNSKWKNIHGI